jgi:hypothetical protein
LIDSAGLDGFLLSSHPSNQFQVVLRGFPPALL